MKRQYEFAIVGCGGIGSAAAYWLAKEAGADVLALEQFPLGHSNGASQDHSRIMRLSYHSADYTALTPHTYVTWAEIEAESGVQLVHKTGGLDLFPERPDTDALAIYAGAMREAGFPFDELSAGQVMRHWPQFRLRGDERALYQEDTGIVDAGKANAAHVILARALGATIIDQTPVRVMRLVNDVVEIETENETFQARHVIVAADAWTNQVLAGVGVQFPLTVTQEQVTYFATPHLKDFAPGRFPVWIWRGEEDVYGFPVYGEVATKAGIDIGGDEVTPESRTFQPNTRSHERLCRFLERYIPRSVGPVLYTKTCLYTLPPDRDFVIDALPGCPQIIVAQGAAHAFKFASLLGRIAADLAIRGKTNYPIAAFRADRPSLTDRM